MFSAIGPKVGQVGGHERCIHHGLRPFDAIEARQLFKHDLTLLAIGCVHGDEVKTLKAIDQGSFDPKIG